MSDALGQDQFQPVNRRAGYGDALEMALSAARKGWTLSAGQGALIVEHYEEKLAAARVVTDAMVERAANAWYEHETPYFWRLASQDTKRSFLSTARAALTAALTQGDA